MKVGYSGIRHQGSFSVLQPLPSPCSGPIGASRLSPRSPARGNAGHRPGVGRCIPLGPQRIRGARSSGSGRTRAPPRRLSKSCRRIPAASPRLFPCPAVLQDLGRGVLCDRLRACRSSPGWCDERGMRDWPSYLPLLPDARGGWFSESLMAGKGAGVTASRSGLPAGDGGNATLSSSSVAPSWPGVRPLRPRAGEPCLGICRERSPGSWM